MDSVRSHPKASHWRIVFYIILVLAFTQAPLSMARFRGVSPVHADILGEIIQASAEINNSQKAEYQVRYETPQARRHNCCTWDSELLNSHKVNTGFPPQNVTDFRCRGFDYKSIQCRFKKPQDDLLTRYTLNYTIDDEVYTCNLTGNQSDEEIYCEAFTPIVRQYYKFVLHAGNPWGENTQHFIIDYHKNVIPDRLAIKLENLTSNSVNLTWTSHRYSYYNKNKYIFKVQLKPEGFDWFTASFNQTNNFGSFSIVVKDLPYAFFKYKVRVRARAEQTLDIEDMWSKPFVGMFETKARIPDRPPETVVGSYYMDKTMGTRLRLFWREMPKYEHNGPEFMYHVSETDQGILKGKWLTNETSLTIPWPNLRVFDYYIKAVNMEGQSCKSSRIRVFPQELTMHNAFRSVNSLYNGSTNAYTLTWKLRSDISPENFTILWCESRTTSANQCYGQIHLEITQFKEFRIISSSPLNFGVAANFINSSSGLHWAHCSAEVNTALIKLKPEVKALNASAIVVRWNFEFICSSILRGYKISYCEAQEGLESECVGRLHNVFLLLDSEEYENYTIVNLKPFTTYRIEMSMISRAAGFLHTGPKSDPIYERTGEGVPSAPRNLCVVTDSITANSAIVSWWPPEFKNGILKKYSICYYPVTADQEKVERCLALDVHSNTDNSPLSCKLSNLRSHTNYQVYVVVATKMSSNKSFPVNFKTLMGVPSVPLNVAVGLTTVKWSRPENASGLLDFYEVALIRTLRDGKKAVATFTVRRLQYQFQTPTNDTCKDYTFKIRAVNVVPQSVYSKKANEKLEMQNDTQSKKLAKINCANGKYDQLSQGFYKRELENMLEWNSGPYNLLCSPWSTTNQIKECTDSTSTFFPIWTLLIALVGTIPVIYGLKYLINEYSAMIKIKAILPDELTSDFIYIHANKEVQIHQTKDTLKRSNDCLVHTTAAEKGGLEDNKNLFNTIWSIVPMFQFIENMPEVSECKQTENSPEMNESNAAGSARNDDSIALYNVSSSGPSFSDSPTKTSNSDLEKDEEVIQTLSMYHTQLSDHTLSIKCMHYKAGH